MPQRGSKILLSSATAGYLQIRFPSEKGRPTCNRLIRRVLCVGVNNMKLTQRLATVEPAEQIHGRRAAAAAGMVVGVLGRLVAQLARDVPAHGFDV
jgi:hypothetical protein